MMEALNILRKNRAAANVITRGELPKVTLARHVILEQTIICIVMFVSASVFFINFFKGFIPDYSRTAEAIGFFCAFSSVIIFLLWPLVVIANIKRQTGHYPQDTILKTFHERYHWLESYIYHYKLVVETQKKQVPIIASNIHNNAGFSLWLGKSTGLLVSLWHIAGMRANQQVTLEVNDACQNILVLGGIGSGKTSCVMQPLLLQCFDQQCGGFIFDIKGDVKSTAYKMAATTNRALVVIGPGHLRTNLLAGLTPEVAASFLKSTFLLNGKGLVDSFWIDTATELCRNTLGMLSFLDTHYNLQSLYQYLFETEQQAVLNQQIANILPTLTDKPKRLLKTYCDYHALIFSNFDQKIKSGVYATVAQALAPFNHPDLQDAFCANTDSFTQIEDMLAGKIYLVDLPLSIWGLGGKVAYTFIKLRFFNLMQNRKQYAMHDQDKPIFFMCDEFQEIVSANRDGLSDLNFWDKSRSSKTIGIISAQSIASFYAALGSHDLAHALLQNFRQKLCFRTEDPITLDFLVMLHKYKRVAICLDVS